MDPLLEKLNQGDFSDLTVDEFGERISERLKEKEGEAWPQLLNLVSTTYSNKGGVRQEESQEDEDEDEDEGEEEEWEE